MKLQNGIQLIIRLIEQQLQLELIHLAADCPDVSGDLGSKLLVAFLIGQLHHHRRIIVLLLQLLKLVYYGFYCIHLADDCLGLLIVIPEIRRGHLLFKVRNDFQLQV
ncbi:hypothetical protein D3C80_1728810 [compost metagenome]